MTYCIGNQRISDDDFLDIKYQIEAVWQRYCAQETSCHKAKPGEAAGTSDTEACLDPPLSLLGSKG